MANVKHLKRLEQGTNAWNEWRAKKGYKRPDLSGADLGGRDLSGINLEGAVLLPADLYDQKRELFYGHSTLTQDEKRALMLRAGLRAGWDDPEMDVYNDLDPRRQ